MATDGPWSDAGDLSALDATSAQHPFSAEQEGRYPQGPQLGRGGMGRVVRSLDRRLLREVALKVPTEGSAMAARRLAQEALVTAQLDHPGVVSVHDAGLSEDGTPFYVMRLVRGQTLAQLVRDRPAASRAELIRHLRDACEAVGYAHHKGFVHRDLKPANIMVGDFGETQVMDWGLARPAPGEAGDWWRAHLPEMLHAETVVGTVVGTPSYLSPEQIQGGPATPRSDVWSLGVVLHEILTGQRAFSGPTPREILTQIQLGVLPPLELTDALAPLGSIVLRATQADPAARFTDAKELADELTRFLEGGRVATHRYTPAELLRETLQTWRAPLLGGALVLLTAGVVVGLALAGARQEARRAATAEAGAVKARALADANLQRALVSQAVAAALAGDRGRAETLAAHALLLGEEPRARGILLDARPRPRVLPSSPAPDCAATSLDPSGRWLACQRSGELALWDLEAEELRWSRDVVSVGSPRVDLRGWVAITSRPEQHLALDERGYTVSEARGPGVPVWLPGDTELLLAKNGLTRRDEQGPLMTGVCTEGTSDPVGTTDGLLATVCFGEVVLWNGERAWSFPTLPVNPERGFPQRVAVDSRRLVWGSQTGHVVAHSLPDGALLWELALGVGAVRSLTLDQAGGSLSVLGSSLGVHILDADTGTTRWVLPELPGEQAAGIDAAGHSVLLAERVHRWELPTAFELTVPGGVTDLSFSPSGDRLAVAAGTSAAILTWSPRAWETLALGTPSTVKSIGWHSDGVMLGLADRLWLIDESGERTELDVASRRAVPLAGGLLLSAGYGTYGPGLSRIDGGTAPSIAQPDRIAYDIEASLDGASAVWANSDGVWGVDARELEPRHLLALDDLTVADASAAHVLGASRTTLTVAARDGSQRWTSEDNERRIMDARFSPAGTLVATGHADGTIRIYDVPSGALLAEMLGHRQQAPALAFHPTEAVLVSGGWDRVLREWDLRRLHLDAEELLAQVQAAWGLSLDDALR